MNKLKKLGFLIPLLLLLAALSGAPQMASATSPAESALASGTAYVPADCDFRSDVGSSHINYYMDETVTPDTRTRPQLWLAVHVNGKADQFVFIKYADEFDAHDLHCWVGGEEAYWSKIQEPSTPANPSGVAWVYNSNGHDPGVFNVQVGRLQVGNNDIVAWWSLGHPNYPTHVATWRPISRDNMATPLRAQPAPQPHYFGSATEVATAVNHDVSLAKFWSMVDNDPRHWEFKADKAYPIFVPSGHRFDFANNGQNLQAPAGTNPVAQAGTLWGLLPEELQ